MGFFNFNFNFDFDFSFIFILVQIFFVYYTCIVSMTTFLTALFYESRDLFHFSFDIDDMIRFTLTVKKNYRNVPYHNWAHAFSVAHAVYTVIKTAKHHFTPVEVSFSNF